MKQNSETHVTNGIAKTDFKKIITLKFVLQQHFIIINLSASSAQDSQLKDC